MLTVFVTCLAFWVVLAPHLSPLTASLGILSAAMVSWANRDLEGLAEMVRALPRLLGYVPWLLRAVAMANLDVMRVVLDPRLPIDPVVTRFATPLRGDLAITTLANSITLTPGTVTLDVEGTVLTVHALTAAGARDVEAGGMDARIARVFPA